MKTSEIRSLLQSYRNEPSPNYRRIIPPMTQAQMLEVFEMILDKVEELEGKLAVIEPRTHRHD